MPETKLCVSDPSQSGFQCSDNGTDLYILPYAESDSYIAMPIADWEKLMMYFKGVQNECGQTGIIW